ncbi:MAG: glutaconate CoA-transferase subunit A [Gammaproteobacteria bacterium]|jgi:glutaconate CoA-transferase subunit A
MFCSLDELVARIADGASVALGPDRSGCAMAAVRALLARGVRDLKLIGVPQIGFQADMLIGAGCVAQVHTAAITLGEYGLAPRFVNGIKSGAIDILDSTCPAMHAGLQAAEKGLPFMPLRGLIGSDLLRARSDWKLIDNPFGDDDPVVLLPAIQPDIALFHARVADRDGNVWVGLARELMLAAHAARETYVTVERVQEQSLLDDEMMAAGTISGLYICAIAEVKQGAWPVGLAGCYEEDRAYLREYVELAASDEGFAAWMKKTAPVERAA